MNVCKRIECNLPSHVVGSKVDEGRQGGRRRELVDLRTTNAAGASNQRDVASLASSDCVHPAQDDWRQRRQRWRDREAHGYRASGT